MNVKTLKENKENKDNSLLLKKIIKTLKACNFKWSSKNGRLMFYSIEFLIALVSLGKDHNRCSVCCNTVKGLVCPNFYNDGEVYTVDNGLIKPIGILADFHFVTSIFISDIGWITLCIDGVEYLMCNLFRSQIKNAITINKKCINPLFEFINWDCYVCGHCPYNEVIMISVKCGTKAICAACYVF